MTSSDGEADTPVPSSQKGTKGNQKRSPSRSPLRASTPSSSKPSARGSRSRGRGRGSRSRLASLHSDLPETPSKPGWLKSYKNIYFIVKGLY